MNTATSSRVAIACGILFTLLAGGCFEGKSNTSTGGVAVVDMDEIATATGRNAIFHARLDAANNQVNQKLNELHTQMQSQIQAKRTSLGESPTPEQEQEFIKLNQNLEQQFRQQVNEAQESVGRLRATIVGQFREEVRPIAERVARERGFTVVMVRSEAMISVDPAADITAAVVAELPHVTPPATSQAPVQPAPPVIEAPPVLPAPATPAE